MSIYQSWGFTNNPFVQTPLKPDAQGSALLVGRDKDLLSVKKRISNPPKITTLEGANGVGKTSLVNVAGYSAVPP